MRQLVKSHYGKINLLRGYCPKCKQMAIILDSDFMCCDSSAGDFEEEINKRMILGEFKRSLVPLKVKREILEKQHNTCIYCDCSFDNSWYMSDKMKSPVKIKIHFDHFIPWYYSRATAKCELVAACHVCNGIKSSKHFNDIESAKSYILYRREQKGILVL